MYPGILTKVVASREAFSNRSSHSLSIVIQMASAGTTRPEVGDGKREIECV
ncbi:MAG: hypothetical protein ACTSUE_25645 [Promethearchaeota archaeon]